MENAGTAVVFAGPAAANIVSVAAGQQVADADFGNTSLEETGSISGTLWDDSDRDQQHDGYETPLVGWTVYLDLDGDRQPDADEPSTVTDENGDYLFTDVPPGEYAVVEVLPVGWKQTSPFYGGGASAGKLWQRFEQPVPDSSDSFGQAITSFGPRLFVSSPGEEFQRGRYSATGVVYEFDPFSIDEPNRIVPHSGWYSLGTEVAATADQLLVLEPYREHNGSSLVWQPLASGGLATNYASYQDRFYNLTTLGDDRVLIGSENAYGGRDTERINLFDAQAAEWITSHVPPDPFNEDFDGWGDEIATFGRTFLSGVRDHVLQIDVDTLELVHVFEGAVDAGFGDEIVGLASVIVIAAPRYDDDSLGVENAGLAYVFDGATGDFRYVIRNPAPGANSQFGIRTAAVAGGQYLLIGSREANYLYNTATGAQIAEFPIEANSSEFSTVEAWGSDLVFGNRLEDIVVDGQVQTQAGAAYLFHGPAAANIVTVAAGRHVVGADFGNTSLAPVEPVFPVTVGRSAVEVQLPADIDLSEIGLYDGDDEPLDEADVVLVGQSSGAIAGSLVRDVANDRVTFVASRPLPPDNYRLVLRSADDAFRTESGDWLDGDGDGQAGGDFVYEFGVLPSAARTLSLDSFALGPGQTTNYVDRAGVPLRIDEAANVTSFEFTLQFDPTQLDIFAASPGANVSAGWQFDTFSISTPGELRIAAHGDEPLAAGAAELVVLEMTVPTDAVRGAARLLGFSSIALNDGAIDAAGATVVHVAASAGDASRNGRISARDAELIARVAVGLDSGFDAYERIHPLLIADISGDGTISSYDAALVSQRMAELAAQPAPLSAQVAQAAAAPVEAADRAAATAAGAIQGVRFNDLDQDGLFEPPDGEEGLVGWTMYLDLNANGSLDSGEPTSVTGDDGAYRFDGLAPDTYVIAGQLQPGWRQTTGDTAEQPGDLLRQINVPDDRFNTSDALLSIDGILAVGVDDASEGGIASTSGAVYLFDPSTGELLHRIANPHPELGGVDFGRQLFSLDGGLFVWDGNLEGNGYLFDVRTGEMLQEYGPLEIRAVQPDGGAMFTAEGDDVVMRNVAGEIVATFSKPDGVPNFGQRVIPSGDRVWIAGYGHGENQEGASFFLFDTASGELIATVDEDMRPVQTGQLTAAIGDLLAVSDYEQVRLYNSADGQLARTIAEPEPIELRSSLVSIRRSDHGLLTWGNERVHLFDVTTGGLLHTFSPDDILLRQDFGAEVQVVGDRLVVKGYADQSGLPAAPAFYQFNVLTGELETKIPVGAFFQTRTAPVSVDGRLAFAVNQSGRRIDLYVTTPRPISIAVADGETVEAPPSGAFDVDDPPVAKNDAYEVDEDSLAVLLPVLENDIAGFDADEPFSIVEVGRFNQSGQAEITPEGLLYSPGPDYFGTEYFAYRVADASGHSNWARVVVTIHPVNDDPSADDDQFIVQAGVGPQTLNVLANDFWAPDAPETLLIASVGAGSEGGSIAPSADGAGIVYEPRAGFLGTETFSYEVHDANGGTANAQVSVRVNAESTGSIEGTLWHDLNSNQVRDSGEPLLVGWSVYVDLNNNRQQDAGEPAQATDEQGRYRFENLVPGEYSVVEELPEDWKQTSPYFGGASAAGDLWRAFYDPTPVSQGQFGEGLAVVGETLFINAPGAMNDDGTRGRIFVADPWDGSVANFLNRPSSSRFGLDAANSYLLPGRSVVPFTDAGDPLQGVDTTKLKELDVEDLPYYGHGLDYRARAVDDDHVVIGSSQAYGGPLNYNGYLFDASTGKLLHAVGDFYSEESVVGSFDGDVLVGQGTSCCSIATDAPVLRFDAESGVQVGAYFGDVGTNFGQQFAQVGDRVLVAAPGANGKQGVLQLFDAKSGELLEAIANPFVSTGFGTMLTTLAGGQYVAVTTSERSPTLEWNEVHIFETSGWNHLTSFDSPVLFTSKYNSVLTAYGADLVVGAAGDDTLEQNAGGAFVFHGPAAANIVSLRPGEHVTGADFGNFALVPAFSVEVTSRGVAIQLPANIDLGQLNLYDGADAANDPADFSLIGSMHGPVSGSVVWLPETSTLEFLSAGGPLADDVYTLRLRSASDAFTLDDGTLLDGDANHTPGGDFALQITVENLPARVVSVADIASSPGQDLELDGITGLPLTLNDAEGVTSVRIRLAYDVQQLHISDVELGGALVGEWTLDRADTSVDGIVEIEASTASATATGSVELFRLIGSVLPDTPLGDARTIRILDLELNVGDLDSRAVDGVFVAAAPGDATGDGGHSALDAAYIARVAVGLDSGFDAFERIHPLLLADVSHDGTISSLDAAYVARKAVGLPVPGIPDPPPMSSMVVATPLVVDHGVSPNAITNSLASVAMTPLLSHAVVMMSAGVDNAELHWKEPQSTTQNSHDEQIMDDAPIAPSFAVDRKARLQTIDQAIASLQQPGQSRNQRSFEDFDVNQDDADALLRLLASERPYWDSKG
ncbi:MAG: cadherin-like domain-containing protein [Planctomycetales bacterium]|nr:cadherin-like domain-containing protein [Planctomycetales bacterium]